VVSFILEFWRFTKKALQLGFLFVKVEVRREVETVYEATER